MTEKVLKEIGAIAVITKKKKSRSKKNRGKKRGAPDEYVPPSGHRGVSAWVTTKATRVAMKPGAVISVPVQEYLEKTSDKE